MIHPDPHPLAGSLVALSDGTSVTIEDWWDRVAGISWMVAEGNPAALKYAIRGGMARPPLPLDNEVLYGDGMLFHESEIVGR